jgi:GH43 family beta-xylosidase
MPYKYMFFAVVLLNVTCSKKSTPSAPPVTIVKDTSFVNPLLSSGPDPWVVQKDTMYYYTNTFGDRLALYSTNKMSDLKNATITTIWTPPVSGMYSKEIWAPEIHYLQNKWYAYFAADDGVNDNHRIYALECDDADPVKGTWTFKGKISDTLADRWAIDASVFEYNNQLYMAWSGWQGSVNIEQDIFIAKMKDPLTLDGPRILISSPANAWESMGAPPAVNEGPEAIINNGKLFLTFSASGCWTDSYSLGLLRLKDGGDPMLPTDWTKSAAPVFSSASQNGAYAPGHNGFFKSRDGKEDWILYHANSQSGQGCGDARNPRMQQFTWATDGSPDFGTPVKINTPLHKPGGE